MCKQIKRTMIDIINTTNTTDLIELQLESHNGINYKFVELKTELEWRSYRYVSEEKKVLIC